MSYCNKCFDDDDDDERADVTWCAANAHHLYHNIVKLSHDR